METYLSIEELAEYLGIAEKTVRKWVLNRDIPYRKIMKVIRFRLSEIEEWIEAGEKFSRTNDSVEAGFDLFAEDESEEDTSREENKAEESNAQEINGNTEETGAEK